MIVYLKLKYHKTISQDFHHVHIELVNEKVPLIKDGNFLINQDLSLSVLIADLDLL